MWRQKRKNRALMVKTISRDEVARDSGTSKVTTERPCAKISLESIFKSPGSRGILIRRTVLLDYVALDLERFLATDKRPLYGPAVAAARNAEIHLSAENWIASATTSGASLRWLGYKNTALAAAAATYLYA